MVKQEMSNINDENLSGDEDLFSQDVSWYNRECSWYTEKRGGMVMRLEMRHSPDWLDQHPGGSLRFRYIALDQDPRYSLLRRIAH